MALTLIVRCNEGKASDKISFDAPRIIIGRGESSDLRLPDPSVSLRHASIRQRGADYIVVDEGSTNGTYVGPVRLPAQAPRVIRPNDVLRLGRIWLKVMIEPQAVTVNPSLATRELALNLVANALEAEGEDATPRIQVREGPDAGKVLILERPEQRFVIGRSKQADLILTDIDASRRHVEVFRRQAQVFVRELGSKNGTLLGRTELVADRETSWLAASELVIGANRLGLIDPVGAALEELELAADEHLAQPDLAGAPEVSPTFPPAPVEIQAPADGGAQRNRCASSPRGRDRTRPSRIGWADVLIAGTALAVLAASLFALSWLLGGH